MIVTEFREKKGTITGGTLDKTEYELNQYLSYLRKS